MTIVENAHTQVLDKIHNEHWFTARGLAVLQESSGIDRETLAYSIAGVLALLLMATPQAHLLANGILVLVPCLLMFVYPSERPPRDHLIIYWSAFGVLTLFDRALEATHIWYVVKIILLILLFIDDNVETVRIHLREMIQDSKSVFDSKEMAKLRKEGRKSPPPEKPEESAGNSKTGVPGGTMSSEGAAEGLKETASAIPGAGGNSKRNSVKDLATAKLPSVKESARDNNKSPSTMGNKMASNREKSAPGGAASPSDADAAAAAAAAAANKEASNRGPPKGASQRELATAKSGSVREPASQDTSAMNKLASNRASPGNKMASLREVNTGKEMSKREQPSPGSKGGAGASLREVKTGREMSNREPPAAAAASAAAAADAGNKGASLREVRTGKEQSNREQPSPGKGGALGASLREVKTGKEMSKREEASPAGNKGASLREVNTGKEQSKREQASPGNKVQSLREVKTGKEMSQREAASPSTANSGGERSDYLPTPTGTPPKFSSSTVDVKGQQRFRGVNPMMTDSSYRIKTEGPGSDNKELGPGHNLNDLIFFPKNKLVFNAPFDFDNITYHMRIKNTSYHKLAYAIKGNAVPRVTAYPPSDLLKPGEERYIAVTVQKFDWNPDQYNKDRICFEWILLKNSQKDVNQFSMSLFSDNVMRTRKNILIIYNP